MPDGHVLERHFAARGAVDGLDLDTRGVELAVSKGFAFLTPYAGIDACT